MIRSKRINNHKIKPIKVPKVNPDRIKGYSLIPKLYCTMFLCAQKESGKTNAIFKILKECANKKTHIFIVSSTVYNDDNWIEIVKYFEDKDIQVTTTTSLIGDDINFNDVLDELKSKAKSKIEKNKNKNDDDGNYLTSNNFASQKEEEEEEIKPKKVAPEYIFVFDDMSTELRNKNISTLIKKHRHFLNKVIVSSQYCHDLGVDARKNIDFWLIWGGHSEEKLKIIYQNLDLKIPYEDFLELYEYATAEPYHFLFVDRVHRQFRKDFTHELFLD